MSDHKKKLKKTWQSFGEKRRWKLLREKNKKFRNGCKWKSYSTTSTFTIKLTNTLSCFTPLIIQVLEYLEYFIPIILKKNKVVVVLTSYLQSASRIHSDKARLTPSLLSSPFLSSPHLSSPLLHPLTTKNHLTTKLKCIKVNWPIFLPEKKY